MPKGVLVGDSPEFAGKKPAIPCEEVCRTRGLVHIKRLAVRVCGTFCDVVQLEIREGWHPHDPVLPFKPWAGQFVAGQVDRQGRGIAWPEISWWVVQVGLAVDPSLVSEGQSGDVTVSTANESTFPIYDGVFNLRITGDDSMMPKRSSDCIP